MVQPRELRDGQYRYTVDEILSLMVRCGDDQVLLYDVCNMAEYEYYSREMRQKDVTKHAREECVLNNIFETFIISSTRCLKHSDRYWLSLAPGADLLARHLLELEEEGYPPETWELAQTRLNIQSDSAVFISCVPLVHALPCGAVNAWLQFVGRKFSDIPRGDKNKHTPFNTVLLY